jgi:hypothetical protein
MGWFFISIVLGALMWMFFAKGNISRVLAVLSVFHASIALPIAVFSALTGIYPKYISLKGYYYYEHSESHLGQEPLSSNRQPLKTMGWLQVIFLAVTIGISSVYLLR